MKVPLNGFRKSKTIVNPGKFQTVIIKVMGEMRVSQNVDVGDKSIASTKSVKLLGLQKYEGRIAYRFSYAFCHNDAKNMSSRPTAISVTSRFLTKSIVFQEKLEHP